MTSRMASTSLSVRALTTIWLVPGLAVTAKFGTTWDFSPLASKILLENCVAQDGLQLLRGVVPGEIEEFPLLGSADDLFDLLGRQLVDGRGWGYSAL